MQRQIDKNRLFEMVRGMPPSPRNPKIAALGVASLVVYFIAAYSAWQIGSWWGVGLVVSFYVISTLDDLVHEEHRQELIELQGLLIKKIVENSDILDDTFPKTGINKSDEDYP